MTVNHRCRPFFLALIVGFTLSGCYVRTYATPIEPLVPRGPTCADAVAVFVSEADVEHPYVPLARITIWYPPDAVPTPESEQMAQRKKAAQFGANGLILGHALDERQRFHDTSIAVFIADDSASAHAVCERN